MCEEVNFESCSHSPKNYTRLPTSSLATKAALSFSLNADVADASLKSFFFFSPSQSVFSYAPESNQGLNTLSLAAGIVLLGHAR